MTQIEQVLIPCEVVGDGMFPDEVRLQIKTHGGSVVSALADKRLLEERDGQCFLRATRMSMQDGVSVCLLPSEETDTGSRWVRVRSDLLQAA